jgi:hypothetical protein
MGRNRSNRGAGHTAPFSYQGGKPSVEALDADPSFGTFSPPQHEVGPVADATPNVTAEPTVKAVRMELNRNYVPVKLLSVIGWNKPAVLKKNAAGQMVEVEPAEFVEGPKPAPYPGAGFDNKIWAGTIIEVPEDEAKRMRSLKIAEAVI